MGLVFRRAASARALLAAAALLATLTTALLTAFLQYAQLLPAAGARAIIAASPAEDRALLASGASGSTATEVTTRDAAVRKLFVEGVGGVPADVAGAAYASGQRLPDNFGGTVPDTDGTYAVVAFLDALPEHAELVSGAWPRSAPAGQPAQVAVPEPVARTLALRVGDPVPITDERVRRPAPVQVVGVFQPRDPAEPYWELAAAPVRAGGYGPMVVDRDEFLARYVGQSTLDWVVVPRLADLSLRELTAVHLQAGYLATERAEALGVDPTVRIRTGLVELGPELGTAALVTRSGLLLPVLLFAVIAGYALLLIARLLADQRQGENALLRARGAARAQLARFATGEALLVVVPAALLGPPLAAAALTRIDRWSTQDGLPLLSGPAPLGVQTPLGPLGSGPSWVVAALAALGCAAALVAPAARRRGTWVAEQQARSRPVRLAWAARAGVDLALVAVALIAAAQLRQYRGTLTRTAAANAGLDIDPLLVTAPTLGVLAATALSLRLLPVVTRTAVRTGDGASFARLLGLWQADRRPHAGPVLLLVLAVASGALAVCVAGTWQRSQQDQATHRVGADLRVTRPTANRTPDLPDGLGLPGVATTMAVYRGQLQVGGDETVTLLGVDAAAAGDVVRLRSDLAAERPPALFGRLARARVAVPGATLAAGAQRLTGEVRLVGASRIEFGPLTGYVTDGGGIVRALPLGLPSGDRLAVDVALPAGAQRLIGIAGGARVLFDYLTVKPFTGTAEWSWTRLSTVDGAGGAAPVALPEEWVTLASGDESRGFKTERFGTTVRTEVTENYGDGWQFLLTDPGFRPQPIPALVTTSVLAAAGAEVGDTVSTDSAFGGSGLDVTVVGTLDTLPSAEDGAGIAVDLPTLGAYRWASRESAPEPAEWWLATGPDSASAAAAARDRGLVVADRRAEIRRLLDDPLGSGVLMALYVAALAGTVLAAFGLAIDARATALRRSGEMAVLHTLGASPGSLARALVVEQSVLAGLGVLAGAAVGFAVAALLAPSLVPTASGTRPVPEPLLTVPATVLLPAVVLFVVALVTGAAVARRTRRDVVAGLLRIGQDR